MGWYGFYAVSTLYLTNSVADGGLGFSSADRGVIQGLATFFLYLFPAVFGALADRYGFKRMFLASAVVMAPAYILLAAPRTFWGFLSVYFLVAVGHGMFKPVVISTVAKTTTEETSSMGFGIFYMMVNIGGFCAARSSPAWSAAGIGSMSSGPRRAGSSSWASPVSPSTPSLRATRSRRAVAACARSSPAWSRWSEISGSSSSSPVSWSCWSWAPSGGASRASRWCPASGSPATCCSTLSCGPRTRTSQPRGRCSRCGSERAATCCFFS